MVLQKLYQRFPFDLTGDCSIPPAREGLRISCVINFYGRLDLLQGILCSLAEQHYPRDRFEVILVGFSFYGLKERYSWPVWLLLLANCARHAPLLWLPARRFKEQGRFGVGFLAGVLDGIRGSKGQVYG